MKTRKVTGIVCAMLGVSALACVTQATDDELNEMCDNLVDLRGEIPNPSVETITGDISMKFDKQTKQLEASRTQEQNMLNKEMQEKLEAAKTDDEKDEIRKEYKERIEEVSSQHAPRMAAINAEKSEALEGAKKTAAENRSLWTEAVGQCVADAKKEGVSQKIARCRIQAKTTDKYWNGCR